MEWKTRRLRIMSETPLFFFFLCSVFALLITISSQPTPCLHIRCQMTSQADANFQKMDGEEKIKASKGKSDVSASLARMRRLLSGPGSWPPRCTLKCGRCTPCKPVHVPVPPGTPVTAEYYPEAWRCKCGNRLYMP